MSANSPAWSPRNSGSDGLEVYLLGRVDFQSALKLQDRWVYELSGRRDRMGVLLMCEHPPLVTIGREGSRSDLLVDERDLAARLMPLHWSSRGGGAMIHAPGQLAVYPILPLDRLGLGLAAYRRCLEQAVVDTCVDLQVAARTDPLRPGVFGRIGQLAWLGVAVKWWVAWHGLFLNVAPPLHLLRLVRSAAPGESISSLAAERARPIGMHTVRERLMTHLAAGLGYAHWHVYTGHPLLRRTKKRVHVHA